MINQDRWINSLPKINKKNNEELDQLDHYRWINTISKKKTYNTVKRYSVMVVLFVCGLFLVSAVKNETRNLEKKINNLRASNEIIKFNLEQAILDHEVITSPENISLLAKEYLNTNFSFYKKSQIKNLNNDTPKITESIKKENTESIKKENKVSIIIKTEIAKKIEKKKTEIRKLQELYSKPEQIPDEIKNQVAKKIKEKKIQLKNIYTSPKETITLERAQKWVGVKVVKLFLVLPIIPVK